MTTSLLDTITKGPDELFLEAFDFRGKMADGANLVSFASGYPKVTRVADALDTTAENIDNVVLDGQRVLYRVKGGRDTLRRKIEFLVNDDTGATHYGALYLRSRGKIGTGFGEGKFGKGLYGGAALSGGEFGAGEFGAGVFGGTPIPLVHVEDLIADLGRNETITKAPGEQNTYALDFSGALRPGSAIVSILSGYPRVLRIPSGHTAKSLVLASMVATGTLVVFTLIPGQTAGERFFLDVVVADTGGEQHEGRLIVEITD